MKKITLQTVLIGAITTGLLAAQGPGFGMRGRAPQAGQQADPQQWVEWRVNRLAGVLNLNETQQAQAKSIFEQAFTASQTLRADVWKAQESLAAAVKANRSDQISALAANLGTLIGKMRAIHATAYSDFYNNVLTAGQKEQLDKIGGRGMGLGFGGRGGWGMRGMNCPFGARP
jgi:LTXXQ motif family protein